LTQTAIKFKSISKDRLFYDRYSYCISFRLAEASVLRELNHRRIDTVLNRRIDWRNSVNHVNKITEAMRLDLHTICDILLAQTDCKMVVSTDYGWVYTNDVDLIEALAAIRCLTNKSYTQAVVTRPKNTIKLKKSKYSNRSYLCSVKLTSKQKENICNFFVNQQGYIRVSPALTAWCNGSFHRTQEYFFIDYTEESWAVMLSLIHPGLIRKTFKIITTK
jgi:hypothetical protein